MAEIIVGSTIEADFNATYPYADLYHSFSPDSTFWQTYEKQSRQRWEQHLDRDTAICKNRWKSPVVRAGNRIEVPFDYEYNDLPHFYPKRRYSSPFYPVYGFSFSIPNQALLSMCPQYIRTLSSTHLKVV
jgi:hypothetical protein